MRKYNFILMAFALLLGMAQCKKEPATPNGDNDGGVRITLKVNDGNNGEKLNVYPATGAVIFTQGDEIYVGNNGKYVGTLTFDNGLFQGTIDGDLSTDDYLHFYFVGNKPTSPSTLTSGNTTYTVDISDQSTGLPAISYAPSTAKYSPSTTAYTAKLLNKSALVKFVPSVSTSQPITVSGLNNKVQIDFANHTLAPTGNTGGITLYSESDSEKWAVLLEQASLSNLTVSVYGYNATIEGLPESITNNMYYNSGIGISMTAAYPEGAIGGKFTINSNGDQVYFSKGNLQYIGSAVTPYWKFADNQWEFLGNNGQGGTAANVDRDLFCFGASGYPHGATVYQPWDHGSYDDRHYAYGVQGNNLNDGDGRADWGYNAIQNGGNRENIGWRTLSKDEWLYLLNTRSTTSGILYAKAKVNEKDGIVLLPDTWDASIYAFSGANTHSTTFNSNVISLDTWNNNFETDGAVFLPISGWVDKNDNGPTPGYNATPGAYWSSTAVGSPAWYFDIYNTWIDFSNSHDRGHRRGVRLVRNVQ